MTDSARAGELLGEWELEVDGPATNGRTALLVPVRADGEAAMLKVGHEGDEEGEFEALALHAWEGRGSVRLLRAAPRRRALLLERLHPADAASLGDLEACEVVAGLYGRLHRPAPPQLHTVTSYVERWVSDLAALPRTVPIPRRLVEQCLHLARDLVADPASTGTLVHGDLHHHHVLAADREPWLVIDPMPMSGDPHVEPAPMLASQWHVATESGDVRGTVRRRFHTLVDHAGLDEQRAVAWVVVRMVRTALRSVQGAEKAGRSLTADDRDWITRCVTIAKAVQD